MKWMGDDIIIDLPAVKLVEWISAAVARICFVWENHTNSVQASRIPNMCGFYVESIQMLVRNWIRQHFLGWDVIGWTLQFDLAERMMGDFSGFWWQRCHWFHVSSTSPLDRMCHGPKTPAPIHNSNDNTNVKKVAEKNMNKIKTRVKTEKMPVKWNRHIHITNKHKSIYRFYLMLLNMLISFDSFGIFETFYLLNGEKSTDKLITYSPLFLTTIAVYKWIDTMQIYKLDCTSELHATNEGNLK